MQQAAIEATVTQGDEAAATGTGVQVESKVPDGATGSTAFFLFSSVHRDRVKSHLQQTLPEGEKVTIGMVGKKIGALWQQCSDEVKAAYTAAAKEVCT